MHLEEKYNSKPSKEDFDLKHNFCSQLWFPKSNWHPLLVNLGGDKLPIDACPSIIAIEYL